MKKITNISNKVIHIGATMLMPDASENFSDKVASCGPVKAMAEKNNLRIEPAAEKKEAPKAPEAPKQPKAPKNEESADKAPDQNP